tara:strand:- start:30 stop:305 length:276 start_codon:yes stop_codon:yes gene_type:complete
LSLYTPPFVQMLSSSIQSSIVTPAEEVRQLAKRLPEGLPARVFTKLDAAEVLPVPLASAANNCPNQAALATDSPMEIVWNHRWKYDKESNY